MSLLACVAPKTPFEPGEHTRPVMTLAATGVQVYEWRAESGQPGPAWTIVAANAELFDAHGRSVGAYGAGLPRVSELAHAHVLEHALA